MRIEPLIPENLNEDVRYVHDEIANLIGRSQSQVNMMNENGALLGPFPPMLQYPQFGIAALSFIRTLDTHATLSGNLREIAILTVGSAHGARFILYAHEIMAEVFGITKANIAALTAGDHPGGLNDQEAIVHDIAFTLTNGDIISDATYEHAVELLGKDSVAELFFLIGAYNLIAVILNGFDIPAH